MKKLISFLLVLALTLVLGMAMASADCAHSHQEWTIEANEHRLTCVDCGEMLCCGDHKIECQAYDEAGGNVCEECGAVEGESAPGGTIEVHKVHTADGVWTQESDRDNGDYHVQHCIYHPDEIACNEPHRTFVDGKCVKCGMEDDKIEHVVSCENPDYCVNCERSVIGRTYVIDHGWIDEENAEWVVDPRDDGCHVTYCTKCNEIALTRNHNVVEDPEVPATTTETGLTWGSHCDICGTVIVAQEEIPMIGKVVVPAKQTIKLGDTYTIKPKQSGVPGVKFTYKSSNTKIAVVDSKGVVTAKKAGTATITVTSSHGEKATMKVTVKTVKITGLKSSATVKVGKTLTLKPKQTGTKNAKFTFKTSDKKIATVDKSGKVKGVKKGTATITVTSCFGETFKVKVTVK